MTGAEAATDHQKRPQCNDQKRSNEKGEICLKLLLKRIKKLSSVHISKYLLHIRQIVTMWPLLVRLNGDRLANDPEF